VNSPVVGCATETALEAGKLVAWGTVDVLLSQVVCQWQSGMDVEAH
jgi:hypothetical protein